MRAIIILLILICSCFSTANATPSVEDLAVGPVKPSIITEQAKGASKLRIGVKFEIVRGWHIYSNKPGEIGLPTSVNWSTLKDISISTPNFPAAEIFDNAGIKSSGYEKEVLIWSDVSSNTGTLPETLSLEVHVSWLACRDECIPGKALIHKTINIKRNAAP